MAHAPHHGPRPAAGTGPRARASLAKAVLVLVSFSLAACAVVIPAAGQVVLDRGDLGEQKRRHRLSQYQAMQTAVLNMPRLDAKRVDEVLSFRVVDGSLSAAVPQPEWVTRRGGRFRVEVAALPGLAYVQLANVPAFHRPGRRPDTPVPVGSLQAVAFVHRAMPDPTALATLVVQSDPGSFSLNHTIESDDGHQTVRLVEQRNPNVPGGGTVQLWAITSGGANARAGGRAGPLNLHLVADDFPTLVRENPDAVEVHLRPLFARLGQEQAFAPDPHVAWQVLAEYWPPDPAVARQVAGLLPDFDHPNYRVRERALDQLVGLGRPAAAVLLRHDRAGFSASRHLMVDRALAEYGPLPPAETDRLRTDVGFVLDCLHSDDQTVRSAAARHLRKLTGRPDLRFDPDAPAGAERLAAVAALRRALYPEPASKISSPPDTRRPHPGS